MTDAEREAVERLRIVSKQNALSAQLSPPHKDFEAIRADLEVAVALIDRYEPTEMAKSAAPSPEPELHETPVMLGAIQTMTPEEMSERIANFPSPGNREIAERIVRHSTCEGPDDPDATLIDKVAIAERIRRALDTLAAEKEEQAGEVAKARFRAEALLAKARSVGGGMANALCNLSQGQTATPDRLRELANEWDAIFLRGVAELRGNASEA